MLTYFCYYYAINSVLYHAKYYKQLPIQISTKMINPLHHSSYQLWYVLHRCPEKCIERNSDLPQISEILVLKFRVSIKQIFSIFWFKTFRVSQTSCLNRSRYKLILRQNLKWINNEWMSLFKEIIFWYNFDVKSKMILMIWYKIYNIN